MDAKLEVEFNERLLNEDNLCNRKELLKLAGQLRRQKKFELLPAVYARLAQLDMEKRGHKSAVKHCRNDWNACLRSEDIIGAIESKLNMAICYADAGQLSSSMALFNDALMWAKGLSMPEMLANVEVNLALCELLFGNKEKALARLFLDLR